MMPCVVPDDERTAVLPSGLKAMFHWYAVPIPTDPSVTTSVNTRSSRLAPVMGDALFRWLLMLAVDIELPRPQMMNQLVPSEITWT